MLNAKTFRITRIDPELMRKFKAACSYYDLDMRAIFIQYMSAVVTDYEWALSNKKFGAHISVDNLFRVGYTLEQHHLALGDVIERGRNNKSIAHETSTIKQSKYSQKGDEKT